MLNVLKAHQISASGDLSSRSRARVGPICPSVESTLETGDCRLIRPDQGIVHGTERIEREAAAVHRSPDRRIQSLFLGRQIDHIAVVNCELHQQPVSQRHSIKEFGRTAHIGMRFLGLHAVGHSNLASRGSRGNSQQSERFFPFQNTPAKPAG